LCRLYLVPGIGSRRIDKLSVRDVQTWFTKVKGQCQCCAQGKDARRPEGKRRCCAIGKCCASLPSARTVSDARTILRSALGSAITEELITKNVAAMVKMPSVRRRKVRAWSSDEARAFLESARENDDVYCAAFVLVLVLGLRKGEVLGLGWDGVDLVSRELVIEWQIQRVKRELLRRETKTEASDDALPLPEICLAALRHRADRRTASAAMLVTPGSARPSGRASSSPVHTGRRSSRAASIAPSRLGAARPGCAGSPCTTLAGPARPFSSISTCTLG